ncbi:MAG: hypothetical protein JW990_19390 [Thermoleophilia bacterium]|nr:hypothetical protein [Thermoleophilia bacterium]
MNQITSRSDLMKIIGGRLMRAYDHAKELDRDVASLFESNRAHIRLESNAEKTDLLGYVVYADPHPSIRWGTIIGDYSHCLRSALDNTVYAIAFSIAGYSVPPEYNRLCFPIADTNADWKAVKSRVRSLPDQVRSVIEAVQPCHGGNRALSTIGHFNDIDKHRLPILGAGAVGTATATCRNLSPGASMFFGSATGPVADDQPLIHIAFSNRQVSEPDMDFDLALQVFIREGTEWQTANRVLLAMREETEIIIAKLASFIV